MKNDKFILLLLLFIIAVFGYQVQFLSYVLSVLAIVYYIITGELKISNYKILLPLVLLLILGTRYGTGFKIIHIVRDYVYFSSPIFSFLLGTILYKKLAFSNLKILFVTYGTIYSLYFLLQTTLQFGSIFISDTYDTRYSIGTGTPIPVLAFFFSIFSYKEIYKIIKNHYVMLGVMILNGVVLYYFSSRVYYFTILIFILLYLFYSFVSKYKQIGLILFLGVSLILFFGVYQMINGEGFLAEKMRNSLNEMFIQEFDGYESIINNWRAYEVFEVFNTMVQAPLINQIFGYGFGMLVYLEMGLLMPNIELNYIPIFHNGFAYVFVKTGFVGVIVFIAFGVNLLLKAKKRLSASGVDKITFTLLLGCVLTVYFTTLVVNGFFSGESFYFILFIGYLYELICTNNLLYENKHNNCNI